jgi:CNT family concentrative nucleoside transporter
MTNMQGILGIVVLVAIGVLLCPNRSRINWRIVFAGLLLQIVLAFLLLSFGPVRLAFEYVASGFNTVIKAADSGIEFLFGPNLTNPSGPWGFVFAFKVLPIIIFFAALMSVLYHLGIMQRVVAAVAWVLRRVLGPGVTGSEAVSAAANIFVGQTEAPLFVRPFLPSMTRSQLLAVMAGGFATIAGSVMAAYVGILGEGWSSLSPGASPDEGRILFAKHLLTASVMSAPASFVMAKLLLPETQQTPAEDLATLRNIERTTRNLIDAAAAGATDGLRLAANVAAMLIAFVALLALIDLPIAWLGRTELVSGLFGNFPGPDGLSLSDFLGWALQPIAWLFGVSAADASAIGGIVGTGVIATEFVGYIKLQALIQAGSIDPRSAQIATYALCGFANIPSIAIQIGGLSALAPSRRSDLASLAPRAMLAGLLACWMTAAVASLFIR